MKIDLDSYLQQLIPWELTIGADGKDHKVRPMTLGDLGIIENIGGGKGGDVGNVSRFLESCFEEPKPDVSKWTMEAMMIALMSISFYVQDRSKKNQAGVMAALDAQRNNAAKTKT